MDTSVWKPVGMQRELVRGRWVFYGGSSKLCSIVVFMEVQGAVKGLIASHTQSHAELRGLRDLFHAETGPLSLSPTQPLFPFTPLCLPFDCVLCSLGLLKMSNALLCNTPPCNIHQSSSCLSQSSPRWWENSLAQGTSPTVITTCHALFVRQLLAVLSCSMKLFCFLLLCSVLFAVVMYHEYTFMVPVPDLLHDFGWISQSKMCRCWAVGQLIQKWQLSWCASLMGHMVPDLQRCWRQLTGTPCTSHY